MGILRNSIEVVGISTVEELPREIKGQLIEYSETDYIYVPENRPLIYNISKIDLKLSIKESRSIDAPTGKIVILEGSRKINITYKPASYYEGNYILKLDLPFNSFLDIPNNSGEIKSIDIYPIDAYFKMMSSRKIYCFMVYMINVIHENMVYSKVSQDSNIKIKTLK